MGFGNQTREVKTMREQEKLRDFCSDVIRYVGAGYTHFKIVKIPNDKLHRKNEILLKVSNHYETNLTRGMRHKRRAKNIANYAGVFFKDTIIIFRTVGDVQGKEKEGEFKEVGRGLEIIFSEFLGLILHKDERDIWTWRLSRDTYKFFRGEFEIIFKNKNGKRFHILNNMWGGLPRYKGIGKQKKELNKLFQEWSKKYKVNWKLF